MRIVSDPTKRRWVAWGGLAGAFLVASLYRLSTAVLSESLTLEFGLTAAQLGTLHASFFLVYALVQVPAGVLVDRRGPRYVAAGGALAVSAGGIGFALSESYHAAVLSRGLIGLGGGVVFVSTLRFAANWYRPDEFATITGLTAGMAGLGSILATTPLALAFDSVGWRWTLVGLGCIGAVNIGVVAALAHRSPAAVDLEPIPDRSPQPSATTAETREYLRELAGDLEQWLLSLCFFSTMGSIMTLLGLWGVPYLVVVYGLDVTTASYYTLLGAVGILIGAPAVGTVSDRFGRRLLPMAVGYGSFAVVLGIIPALGRPPLPVIAVAYFLTGSFIGVSVLTLSVVKEKYPTQASGVATGTVVTAGFLGATVLPTLLGLVLDAYRTGDTVSGTVVYTEGGYRVAFSLLAGVVALAFVGSLWLLARDRRD